MAFLDQTWLGSLNSIILYPWFKDTILLGRGTLLINMPQRNSWPVQQMQFFSTQEIPKSFLLLCWPEGRTSLKVKITVWLILGKKQLNFSFLEAAHLGQNTSFYRRCDHVYSGSEIAFSHS